MQNYEYSPETGIHGMVFDPTETYLYSADLRGNSIWTHKKDPETGHLTLVNRLQAPAPGDHPRWVAIHPSGNYLYALMEAGNRLGVYIIDEQSHIPTFTHLTYPLIPPGTLTPPDQALKFVMPTNNHQASPTPKCTAQTYARSHTAGNTCTPPRAPTHPT